MSEIVTQEEMERRRKLREARAQKADKANVAIGWITPDLEVDKDAPKLPKRPKDAA